MVSGLFSVKNMALLMLVLQNTFLIICMSLSRKKAYGENGEELPLYVTSTAVVVMEVVKLVSCIVVMIFIEATNVTSEKIIAITGNDGENKIIHFFRVNLMKTRIGLNGVINILYNEVYGKPREVLLVAVPSLLYVVQNNLLYVALSNLDAATFQVGYQIKILTTALFSYFMLSKRLSLNQWLSLIMLTIGVVLTQLSAQDKKEDAGPEDRSYSAVSLGFICVFLASCTSGFSGVYFERILKTSSPSIWLRNVQMSIFSITIALASVYLQGKDYEIVRTKGFFYGYNYMVLLVVSLQAIGGLVVAVVVKYADNILKGFAASFSIVTSCLIMIIFMDFSLNWMFVVGAVLVNLASYIYATFPYKEPIMANDNDEMKALNSGSPIVNASSLAYLTQSKGKAISDNV